MRHKTTATAFHMSYCTSSHGDDWSALGLLFKVFSFGSQEYTMAQPWHPSSHVRRLIGHQWHSCKHVIKHLLIASKQVFLSCVRQTAFTCSLPDYLTRFLFTLNHGKNNHYTLFSALWFAGSQCFQRLLDSLIPRRALLWSEYAEIPILESCWGPGLEG